MKPGLQGLLPILFNTSDRWNQVQRETPEKTEESLWLVLFQCPAAGARAAVEELPEQRGGASGSPGNGLDYPGGPLEDPRLESSGRGFGRSAGGEDMGDRDGHCGDDRTAQAHRPGDGVSLPVPQGSLQGPTDVVGSALELSVRGKGVRARDIVQSWIGCAAFHTLGCRLWRERSGLSQQARSLHW